MLTVTQLIPILYLDQPGPDPLRHLALSSKSSWTPRRIAGRLCLTSPDRSIGAVLAVGTNVLSVLFTPTDTNDYTTAATNVSLLVQPATPPVFQTVGQSSGTITFTWSTTPGEMYQMLYATNLNQSNWIPVGSAVLATNSTLSASDLMTNTQRYYRLLLEP